MTMNNSYLDPSQRYSAKMRDQTPYLDIQNLWAQGVHISSNGKQWNIADMPATYLKNVINKFSSLGYDVTALEVYLEPANAPPTINSPTNPTAQASL
jgi:hypothetical protein